jgi:hypothetical protein
MLGVGLVGSRRIWAAHVGCLVGPDGSRRIQKDRLDDHRDDQGASDRKSDGKASRPCAKGSGPPWRDPSPAPGTWARQGNYSCRQRPASAWRLITRPLALVAVPLMGATAPGDPRAVPGGESRSIGQPATRTARAAQAARAAPCDSPPPKPGSLPARVAPRPSVGSQRPPARRGGAPVCSPRQERRRRRAARHPVGRRHSDRDRHPVARVSAAIRSARDPLRRFCEAFDCCVSA